MATTNRIRVSFFDVYNDGNHSVYYKKRVDQDVEPGDVEQTIEAVVSADELPSGGGVYRAPSGDVLDIDEHHRIGPRIYVFRLNQDTRLTFVRNEPFIALPLNNAGGDAFITAARVRDGARRWASFACHLDVVRASSIAERIRDLPHNHPRILTIPFCFNVVDSLLQASPWVVPSHTHEHEDEHAEALATHGGVHPPTTSFISVDLEEGGLGRA